ncbi:cation-translocating P-type ATPase [Actinomycetospora sp. NBRC 106378]|uniref:heavy metal translocating P-type ATPase n=1 Tax=Actinomycetospora sp. NBRC 106378 TaxID=3032208 RepID=UPI0024A20683|nr:cation-translocating P-type ATPase [Actinomycetospora sp. NBRC 106378]GLZ53973.1 putative cation-transporting P-type ATPase C [Actinomycetospora sp. NBRC 106378]
MTSARYLHPVPDDAPGLRVVSDAAGRVRFDAPGLRSAIGLAVAVEEALDGVEGVRQVHAFPRTGSLVVWYDRDHCSPAAITEVYRGVTASTPHDEPATRLPRSAEVGNGDLLRMAVGGLALLLLGGRRWVLRRPPMLGPTSRTVATGVTIFTGYPFLRGALRALVGGRGAGTDALVSAATVASLVLRENVVALTVLWLLNIGEYLQDLTLRRSRRAISDLLTGARTTTWMRVAPADPAGEAVEIEVPIDRVRVGDEIVVHEHVVLPVDGVVVEASEQGPGERSDGQGRGCLLDQAAITGENLPVTVEVGDALHAGSVLLRGRLVVRATAVGSDTAVGRIIERVEAAQSDRAPIQTVGENFSRRFVPLSFALSAATLLVTRDVRRAMTMLLVACPCAVGLSTPTAISAAIGNGARRGILIKGGSHLEAAGRVDAVVLDKTGTLTSGRPVVTNVVSFDDDYSPEQVLALAASSEIHSRHPLAQAVIRSTEERRIEIPPHEECEVLLGQGMRVQADGRTLLLGSRALFREQKVRVSRKASDWVRRLQRQAETPLLLAVDGKLTGLISLRDTVRLEAVEVLEALRADGVRRIVMLSGDHPDVAEAVAAELGIDEWRAEVMPEDKQDAVRALQAEGYTVAMIGDGTNDAPALALADLGIAMGVAGTDVAVETADVALAGDRLTALLDLRDLGRRGVGVIRQNYGMSIAVNAVGLVVSAGGALSPVVAAILHNASSVAVVANSSRMIRYQLEPAGT